MADKNLVASFKVVDGVDDAVLMMYVNFTDGSISEYGRINGEWVYIQDIIEENLE